MGTRFVLLGLFLLSASLVMANPAPLVPPADWVDRMIVDHAFVVGVAASAARTDVVGLTDWVDRIAAAGMTSERPGDWIDRMVADRSLETAALVAQVGSAKPLLAAAGTPRDMAGTQ